MTGGSKGNKPKFRRQPPRCVICGSRENTDRQCVCQACKVSGRYAAWSHGKRTFTPGKAYTGRNARVFKLFGTSYSEYLLSPLWARIRHQVFVRDHHKCVLCGKPAENAHHTSYSEATLLGKSIQAVCRSCHKSVEFFASGKKTNMTEMRRIKWKIASLHGNERVLLDRGWHEPKPGPVDRRALSQASIQADPPAAGTERHDALCQIPDRTNGVSSRGLPAHALAPDVQAGQPHANGPDSTRTERAARCDQSVSGTDHDEDTRERPGASSLTDLAG